MKRTTLLLLFCFVMSVMVSAQKTWTANTKDLKTGDSIAAKSSDVKPYQQYSRNTSGEYLNLAGTNYLMGSGLMVSGAALMLIKSKSDEFLYTGYAMGGLGLLFTIMGHVDLIKAGKALDEEKKITLHPSSSGIGLALKF